MLATGPGVEAAAARVAAETGARCLPLVCDITDAGAVSAALASIDRLDVLVNNAGLERITPLADPDPEVEETFRRIIDINVNGTFLVTRHALPKMRAGGRVILTASIWSRTAVAECIETIHPPGEGPLVMHFINIMELNDAGLIAKLDIYWKTPPRMPPSWITPKAILTGKES